MSHHNRREIKHQVSMTLCCLFSPFAFLPPPTPLLSCIPLICLSLSPSLRSFQSSPPRIFPVCIASTSPPTLNPSKQSREKYYNCT